MPPSPTANKLTLSQAADLLNVPQSFLIKLLKEGKIPYCETETSLPYTFG